MSLIARTVEERKKSISEPLDEESCNEKMELNAVKSTKALIPYVGKWEDAPEFTHDNEYIKKGYRVNCNSLKNIVKSLFMIHNESMNVWSHLCGVLLFVGLITYVAIWITPRVVFPTLDVIKEQLSTYLGGDGKQLAQVFQGNTSR